MRVGGDALGVHLEIESYASGAYVVLMINVFGVRGCCGAFVLESSYVIVCQWRFCVSISGFLIACCVFRNSLFQVLRLGSPIRSGRPEDLTGK
jgi:hypothetical protein